MNGFTEYLRTLEARDGSPSRAEFEELWQNLRGALVQELQKRGLWNLTPSCLGVLGAAHWWSAVGGDSNDGTYDALDELVGDCYSFVFVKRLRSLRGQLRRRRNIDGVVFLSIRNFVHERQKANDPDGYRLFELLHQAVTDLLDQERLFLWDIEAAAPPRGKPRIRNQSLLGFEPPSSEVPPIPADRELLSEQVERWNDRWLVEMLTAQYQRKAELLNELRQCLLGLALLGIVLFRFGDVLEPLKADLRRRWRALGRHHDPEITLLPTEAGWEMFRQPGPEQDAEQRLQFAALVEGIGREIGKADLPLTQRTHLRRLWLGLTRHAVGEALDGRDAASPSPASDDLPSQRQLAKALGLPRDRLPELFEDLRTLVENWHAANLSRLPVTRSTKDAAIDSDAANRTPEQS